MPDAVGNLYRTANRSDRKYDKGGRLTEADGTRYHYDEEGNLAAKVDGKGKIWHYEWNANGSLRSVVRPDRQVVCFEYDPLQRRTAKIFGGRITRWVWDGNTPLHEWSYRLDERPKTVKDEFGFPHQEGEEPVENLITWVFEEGTFRPAARLKDDKAYSIITDYLGTPVEMYNKQGQKTWEARLDIYGNVANFAGSSLNDCPFRYQGQYEDSETGLYYNRFRYYSPDEGMYLSQDPIMLAGGMELYNYVSDTSTWTDVLGLMPIKGGKTPGGMSRSSSDWLNRYGPAAMRDHHLIPQEMLGDKSFMQQLDKLTGGKGADYLHRQIATITNGLHQNVHGEGWNANFKKWAKGTNNNFSLKDLQQQIKSMMKDYNIPKSSRNFAKIYGCH